MFSWFISLTYSIGISFGRHFFPTFVCFIAYSIPAVKIGGPVFTVIYGWCPLSTSNNCQMSCCHLFLMSFVPSVFCDWYYSDGIDVIGCHFRLCVIIASCFFCRFFIWIHLSFIHICCAFLTSPLLALVFLSTHARFRFYVCGVCWSDLGIFQLSILVFGLVVGLIQFRKILSMHFHYFSLINCILCFPLLP